MDAKIRAIILEVSSQFLEREEAVRGVWLALLSRSNVFLCGPPGTAKTNLVQEINGRITGANMFETLLDKFSPPDIIFGPVSIKALQEDRYERCVDGYAPTAHICFFSEIWKCNAALLNAMLMLLNEHKYKNGKETLDCPIMTAVGDSNEVPEDSSLGAIYDRFIQRYLTHYVSPDNVVELLKPYEPGERTTITLADLVKAQAEVSKVVVPTAVLSKVANLKVDAEHAGFFASDRRWKASIKLLQASAWLEGRKEVIIEDLLIYSAVLWDDVKSASKCAAVVNKSVNPGLAAIIEHVDSVEIILKNLIAKNGGERDAIEAWTKIKEHQAKLDTLVGGDKGEEIKERIRVRIEETLKQILGLNRRKSGI